ncbi:hypothetical protein QC761_0056610 [Podospora bellae-mahoneyi]|uniref:Uncharacterized protein n=1 Tax=Podospora bellae-mahoneyi TaxID=2093777 RepID=A0ABR0FP95_9PEZI|nr:hypothetical protein QC761_0056610 [Podospora bellae-mahoneyi]
MAGVSFRETDPRVYALGRAKSNHRQRNLCAGKHARESLHKGPFLKLSIYAPFLPVAKLSNRADDTCLFWGFLDTTMADSFDIIAFVDEHRERTSCLPASCYLLLSRLLSTRSVRLGGNIRHLFGFDAHTVAK